MAGRGAAGPGTARPGSAWRGRRGPAGRGAAGHGMAGHGEAGTARRGRHGEAWRGKARHGRARPGRHNRAERGPTRRIQAARVDVVQGRRPTSCPPQGASDIAGSTRAVDSSRLVVERPPHRWGRARPRGPAAEPRRERASRRAGRRGAVAASPGRLPVPRLVALQPHQGGSDRTVIAEVDRRSHRKPSQMACGTRRNSPRLPVLPARSAITERSQQRSHQRPARESPRPVPTRN